MIVKQAKSRRKNISPSTFKKLVHVAFPHFMHWLENIEATTQIKQQFSEQFSNTKIKGKPTEDEFIVCRRGVKPNYP